MVNAGWVRWGRWLMLGEVGRWLMLGGSGGVDG